jgi:hypothetical protein
MNRLHFTTALVATLAVVPAANAQKLGAAQAQKEFAEAQKLYQKNRCDEALPKLERVLEATGSPNARLYVARCLRQLGKLPEAYDAMTETVRTADARASEDEHYAETRSAAAAERAALESKIVRVVIAAADAPDGLSVEVNGKPLAIERLGETIALAPGKLSLRATAPGHRDFERKLDLKAGASITVAIALHPEGAPVKPAAAAGASPEPQPDEQAPTRDAATGGGGFGLRGWGWVTLGVGVAGLATFGVAGSMANSRFDDLEQECGGPCPASKQGDIDDGRRLDLIANIGLGVGIAGVVAGTTMILLGGSKKEAAALKISPSASGATLHYARSF